MANNENNDCNLKKLQKNLHFNIECTIFAIELVSGTSNSTASLVFI
jgi:hypothetical protein